jgi:hypothetical protein
MAKAKPRVVELSPVLDEPVLDAECAPVAGDIVVDDPIGMDVVVEDPPMVEVTDDAPAHDGALPPVEAVEAVEALPPVESYKPPTPLDIALAKIAGAPAGKVAVLGGAAMARALTARGYAVRRVVPSLLPPSTWDVIVLK